MKTGKTGKLRKKDTFVKVLTLFFDFFRINLTAKLIFFAIGIFLWFNINLQKDFEASINIPIIVSNIHSDKTLLYPIPEEARIKIRSKGRNLILSDLGKDIYFEIDASGVADSAVVRINSDFFINTSGKELEPLFIFHPQEVRIVLDDHMTKKVPVRLNSGYTLAAGYVTSGEFVLDPDSVIVSGPKTVVDEIFFVNTDKIFDTDLTGDYSKRIQLITNKFSTVSYSRDRVEVYQMVVRKGSNTFKAPVRVVNMPEGKSLLIDPIAVDIKVVGPVNELQNIGADDFSVVADAALLDYSTNRIPLEITSGVKVEWSSSSTEVRGLLY